MRLGRILIIVALILIVGLGLVYAATTYFGLSLLGEGGEVVEEIPTMRSVVILNQEVDPGDKISLDMLSSIEIEEEEFNELMFNDEVQIIGLYARSNYNSGQVLSSTMMVSDPTLLLNDLHSGHAAIIPQGMVAVQIPISRFSGMAYGLTQGDRVNVIATMSFIDLDTEFQTKLPNYLAGVISPGQNVVMTTNTTGMEEGASIDSVFNFSGDLWENLVSQTITGDRLSIQGRAELDSLLNVPIYAVPSEPDQRPRLVSQTVLFNRVVLHIGNFPLLDSQGILIEDEVVAPEPVPEGETPPVPEPSKQPDILTLIVTPQEAVSINFMLYSGVELTLALRTPNDLDVSPTDAVDLQYLMTIYRIPLPTKSPYGLEPPMFELNQPELLNDLP